MVIIIALLIPVVAIATGFFTLKGVQLGLRWQMEVKHEQMPTMETPKVPNPIANIMESKQSKEQDNILFEWLNGPKEG